MPSTDQDALPPLRVAVAQPHCVPGDVAANAKAHAEAVRAAAARVVVFPEMSLTGYDLRAAPVELGDPVWHPVRTACRDTGAVALVGAPVRAEDGTARLSVVRVDADGVHRVYDKVCLGGGERAVFEPGSALGLIQIDGWRVGVGICKDTGDPGHVEATVGSGIDLYVAGLVHRADELAEQDRRGLAIAARGVPVAFASFAGSAGEGYAVAAGRSTIWSSSGHVLARAGAEPGQVVSAVLAGPRHTVGRAASSSSSTWATPSSAHGGATPSAASNASG